MNFLTFSILCCYSGLYPAFFFLSSWPKYLDILLRSLKNMNFLWSSPAGVEYSVYVCSDSNLNWTVPKLLLDHFTDNTTKH